MTEHWRNFKTRYLDKEQKVVNLVLYPEMLKRWGQAPVKLPERATVIDFKEWKEMGK